MSLYTNTAISVTNHGVQSQIYENRGQRLFSTSVIRFTTVALYRQHCDVDTNHLRHYISRET